MIICANHMITGVLDIQVTNYRLRINITNRIQYILSDTFVICNSKSIVLLCKPIE